MCRSPAHKVFPAMYIEGATELAFADVTPDDPDFAYIQGDVYTNQYVLLIYMCCDTHLVKSLKKSLPIYKIPFVVSVDISTPSVLIAA